LQAALWRWSLSLLTLDDLWSVPEAAGGQSRSGVVLGFAGCGATVSHRPSVFVSMLGSGAVYAGPATIPSDPLRRRGAAI
jgi:hypothetical protein